MKSNKKPWVYEYPELTALRESICNKQDFDLIYGTRGNMPEITEHPFKNPSNKMTRENQKFVDSEGCEVFVGDTIVLNENGAMGHKNLEAKVIWDEKHGMFKYTYEIKMPKKTHTLEKNFYGVYNFLKIHNQ